MPAFDFNAIPGYSAAVEKETLSRNACFLPVNESIGKFEVLPMTMRHYVMLRTINSPLLCGNTPNVLDMVAFLWILSPRFSVAPNRHKRKILRHFKKINIKDFAVFVVKSREYVKDTFQDKPSKGSDDSVYSKEYYADVAYLCATFAKNWGWDDDTTLGKPMKRIFQYMKVMREQSGQKVVHFNPSDVIAMKYIATMEQSEGTK